MNRAALIAYGVADWTPLAMAAGVTDVIGLAGRSADASYTLLGYDPVALPDPPVLPAQSDDLPWLFDYFLLRSVVRALAVLVDYRTGGDMSKTYSQLFKQASVLLDAATKAVESRGYSIDEVISIGRLSLDLFEPGPYLGGPT